MSFFDNLKKISFANESDVEQKFIFKFLTEDSPHGLGVPSDNILTKSNIRMLQIDKGISKKLYYPDYAIVMRGIPLIIIEAKSPKENLDEGFREARLYATEINASYPKNKNPCNKIIATNGIELWFGFWDKNEPDIKINIQDISTLDDSYERLVRECCFNSCNVEIDKFYSSLRGEAKYLKPVHLLGGKSIINSSVGENSFGANLALEYKGEFNPGNSYEREMIVKNAYVTSSRKNMHIDPIDKIIRKGISSKISNIGLINSTEDPEEVIYRLKNHKKIMNEICLLVGGVGAGKSTFVDYLRHVVLDRQLNAKLGWVNLDLNESPTSKELIDNWVLDNFLLALKNIFQTEDFDNIAFLRKIYVSELVAFDKGKASLFSKDSDRYNDALFNELSRLQNDKVLTLKNIINYCYSTYGKLIVIVLDNCDKRDRERQLLMFEIATWLKESFSCTIFLPIRDTTFDQYRNEPPLDTVVKDLVFRIDPPLLERVIQSRLEYIVRLNSNIQTDFNYLAKNGYSIHCPRKEVVIYLQAIVASIFQDGFYRRIIVGLAGKNIRLGLEIILDFCKSGHISENEILKIRQSNAESRIPSHIVSSILLKGKRNYYSDQDSHVKNIFLSSVDDDLPDPFVRLSILLWLNEKHKVYGPSKVKGFHMMSSLTHDLILLGHKNDVIIREVAELVKFGCILTESSLTTIEPRDLLSIAPSGFVHLDLLRNVSYLSTVAEDSLFRNLEVTTRISNNITGRGAFPASSKQCALDTAQSFINYLTWYKSQYFFDPINSALGCGSNFGASLDQISYFINMKTEGDKTYAEFISHDFAYPKGTIFDANVTSIRHFGFFVEFGSDGFGIVRREDYNGFSSHVNQSLEAGDWVEVEVIQYNQKHKKFELRLKSI